MSLLSHQCSDKQKRTCINIASRQILEELYQNGMVSTSEKDMNSHRLLTQAEERTGLNKEVIKVRCSEVRSRTQSYMNFFAELDWKLQTCKKAREK